MECIKFRDFYETEYNTREMRYWQDTRHILGTITKNYQMESLTTSQAITNEILKNLVAEESSDSESDVVEDN